MLSSRAFALTTAPNVARVVFAEVVGAVPGRRMRCAVRISATEIRGLWTGVVGIGRLGGALPLAPPVLGRRWLRRGRGGGRLATGPTSRRVALKTLEYRSRGLGERGVRGEVEVRPARETVSERVGVGSLDAEDIVGVAPRKPPIADGLVVSTSPSSVPVPSSLLCISNRTLCCCALCTAKTVTGAFSSVGDIGMTGRIFIDTITGTCEGGIFSLGSAATVALGRDTDGGE